VSNEISNRISAVNVVSNSLSIETVNRVSADNALSVRVDTVSNAVSAEIVTRAAASAALETHINTVSAAVNVVSNAASAEIVTRAAASAALESHINTVSAAVHVVSNAVSAEIVTRAAASAALESHINTVSAAVVVASALATTADGHANTVSAAVVTLKTNGPGTSGTWPINVSGTATSISGFNNPTTASTGSTIVYRDASGYITNSYFYSGTGGAERNASGMSYFNGYNSSDYYMRSYTPAAAAAALSGQAMNISGNATYATSAGSISGYNNPTTAATANTIAYRDASGDLYVRISFANTDMRAPLFYDLDNTGYYANPAGTSNFNYIQGTAQYANYADLAENYLGDADYPQGTVLEFGGDQEITQSTQDMSQRIAGVVSDKPAVLMNHSLKGDFVLPLALQGRVPCRVTGIVSKGDMMVSNGDGTARAESAPAIGSIIGKALENFSGETGIIEVVVGRV
jgi:hypothetical protein